MIAVDGYGKDFCRDKKALSVMLLFLFITEAAATNMGTSLKSTWRSRLLSVENNLPSQISSDGVLFFAQRSGPFYADELDYMWIALRHGLKTMNGYSGLFPPRYQLKYGDECSEIPRRLLSYLDFTEQARTEQSYKRLASQIIPIGFNNCDVSWMKNLPKNISSSDKVYTPEEFAHISLTSAHAFYKDDSVKVLLTINNTSNQTFASSSKIKNDIRISWRLVDENKNPFTGWDERKDLPFDIPGNGSLKVLFAIDVKKYPNAKSVEISLVQEHVFWGHDVGVKTLVIPLIN